LDCGNFLALFERAKGPLRRAKFREGKSAKGLAHSKSFAASGLTKLARQAELFYRCHQMSLADFQWVGLPVQPRHRFLAICRFLLIIASMASATQRTSASDHDSDLAEYRTAAKAITTKLARSNQTELARSGHLGIEVALDKGGRLVVDSVEFNSAASTAGIGAGDILLKADGRAVKSAEELREWLQSHRPGDKIKLSLERNRKPLDLSATLDATSRPLKLSPVRTTLGIQLADAEQRAGAVIGGITAGSPAAKAGLRVGDILFKLDGDTITSQGFVRERFDEKKPGDVVKISLFRNGEEREITATLAAAPAQDLAPRTIWTNNVFRLAVVPVEFADTKHNPVITSNAWADFFFSLGTYASGSNVTGQAVHGSLADYYKEVSCGRLRLEGRVFDWVPLPGKRSVYAVGTNAGNKAIFFKEVVDALIESEGGEVLEKFDAVHFLHAGSRFPTGDRGNIYWPHAAMFSYQRKPMRYFICPEGGKQMADISTSTHEFGHILGLPDLYARPENPGSEGLGAWCLMSNEAGGGRPQHFSAWCKERFGWLNPVLLDPSVKQKLILSPVEGSTNECFKVLARADGSEYYLLENRRKIGFDRSLPGEGLLIWRVVNGKPILEESHGIEGPAGPRVFPTAVPYPSRANNSFTPYTTPSSRTLLGGGAPVYITNIRELSDGRIAFNIGYEYH
jgi:M6 family metalloprotease-like protein